MDRLSSLWQTARTVAVGLLMALGVRTALAEPFHVPSQSMEPTLLVGDYLFASKFAYGYSRYALPLAPPLFSGRVLERPAARGDVVIFRLPRDTGQTYVKRVVGVPGDRVQVIAGILHVNGEPARLERVEDFIATTANGPQRVQRYMETLPGGARHAILHAPYLGGLDNTPVFEVPAGHYFMMGDNRSNSLDSRVSADAGGVGMVPAENLIGRADIRHFSIDLTTDWRDPAQWLSALRLSRICWVG